MENTIELRPYGKSDPKKTALFEALLPEGITESTKAGIQKALRKLLGKQFQLEICYKFSIAGTMSREFTDLITEQDPKHTRFLKNINARYFEEVNRSLLDLQKDKTARG